MGTSWASGNLTATLSYQKIQGSDSGRAAGYGTSDFRPFGGRDRRAHAFGFFGPNGGAFGNPGYILGLGSLPEGVGPDWTADDVSMDNFVPYDAGALESSATPTSEQKTLTVNFNQELSEKIELFGDVLYSDNRNEQNFGRVTTNFFDGATVPASNPFNNLDTEVTVAFIFDPEDFGFQIEDSTLERINVNLGVRIDLADDWQLSVTGSFGEEDGNGVAGLALEGQAFDEALAGFRLDDDGNPILTEPVPALNLFTGEHDPDVDFLSLYRTPNGSLFESNSHTINENKGFEASVSGSLFSITGGDVGLAAGLSLRQESYDLSDNIFSQAVNNLSPEATVFDRDVNSVYFELSAPLISENNQLPLVQQLLFTAAARWDEYSMEYPFDGGPVTKKTFDQVSPQFGFRWGVVDNLTVRINWSESFRAPSLLALGEPRTDWGINPFEDIDNPNSPGVNRPGFVGGSLI